MLINAHKISSKTRKIKVCKFLFFFGFLLLLFFFVFCLFICLSWIFPLKSVVLRSLYSEVKCICIPHMDQVKKELKDEITHILYDQTRRTPIVIPVINEIALKSSANPAQGQPHQRRQPEQPAKPISMSGIPRRKFPTRQVPDSEANDTKARHREDSRAY